MKHSVVSKLALRETRGSLQPHSRGNRVRLFKKCPQRFCVPLDSILDVDGVLRKGHVILGFTKNGRYLISYCLKIDNDDSCPMPRYVYSLHWWEFHQWRPLVQVFTVLLFDKEEIHEDLHLMVAESPDESQIVVYGEIRAVKEDQSHQCHVTICAGPSPHPCQACKYTPFGEVTERCLKHSFAVHFKYDLLPPFPIFNPSANLKMKGTVLFNTGDFLMALRVVTAESNSSNLQEALKSLQVYPDKEDKASKKTCSSFEDGQYLDGETIRGDGSCHCSATGDLERPRISSEGTKSEVESGTSQDSSPGIKVGDVQSTCTLHKHFDRRKIVSGFVDGLNQIHSKQHYPHVVDKDKCLSPSRIDVNNKECKDEHSLGNHDCVPKKECSDERINMDKFDDNAVQTSKSIVNTSSSLHKGETLASQCTDSPVLVAQNSCSEHSSFCNNSSESNYSGSSDLSYNHKVPNACSSCDFGVLVPVLNNNNLTSSVFKVYKQTSDDPSYHELPDVTSEFDMYDGSPPLTVKTCHGRTLKQVFKINESNPNATSNASLDESLGGGVIRALAVQQVTLDLEQCINELIQAHEDLRHSYKSLKDYDVQVVGVCPDSGEVITMARLLVYTRTRQQSASCGLAVSPSPALQCTGFIFSWNVFSGVVRILQVLDLENYPERTRYSKFNMAAREANELRAKFSIPQSISSYVQAFSNHTVFTGKSLKYLRHPFLPLVVVL
ncbi:uncharacterized protein LOC144638475 [Oculina patagonica]